jgi:hypothetical protein
MRTRKCSRGQVGLQWANLPCINRLLNVLNLQNLCLSLLPNRVLYFADFPYPLIVNILLSRSPSLARSLSLSLARFLCLLDPPPLSLHTIALSLFRALLSPFFP